MSAPVCRRVAVALFCCIGAVTSACGPSAPKKSASGTNPGTFGVMFEISVWRPTGGTVTTDDGNINCGTNGTACKFSYPWGTTVNLWATPDAGNMLGTWGGDCLGRPMLNGRYVCSLGTAQYGADKYVVAVFGEAGRTQHPNFSSPSDHGPAFLDFVAKRPDSFECTYCHGSTYGGVGIALSCNNCHASAGHAEWRADCTFCHSAPPATASHRMVPLTTPPTLTSCVFCHAGTIDGAGAIIVDAGLHMNGQIDLVLGSGAGGAVCASCHGAPPETTGHGIVPKSDPPTLDTCAYCHANTVTAEGNIKSGGAHGNGVVDVVGGTGGSGCAACHAAPPSSGKHLAHAPPTPTTAYGETRPFGCGNCHSTNTADHGGGSRVLNTELVLPGGTSTAGAQMSGSELNTTCMVACHFPLGAPQPATPVSWSGAGPLACKDCHSRISPPDLGGAPAGNPPAGPSLHDPPYAEARTASPEATTCWSCHDSAGHQANHVTGQPALLDAATRDAACVACHSPPPGPTGASQVLHRGAGATYEEKTPPVLVGWTDTVNGDFHGARVSDGFGPPAGPKVFGGTLASGFARGQGPLPCSTCHASHASGNAFKINAVVNGVEIPGGRISRTGVGGELLCKACHIGDNHAGCQVAGCHSSDPQPAGSACFMCHGHEGIRSKYFANPYFTGTHAEPAGTRDCRHCHGGFTAPAPEYVAPGISNVQVTGVTSSAATISWTTNEPATTYLEYGVGTAGYVKGDNAEVTAHTVTLTGLSPTATYVWRIRAADGARNVAHTTTQSFTTTSADAVPAPDLGATSIATVPANYTGTATVRWSAVTAPSGTAVQYEVQVASDPSFTSLVNSTLVRTDTSLPTGNSGWITGTSFNVPLTNLPPDDCGTPQPVNHYYFRVRARDAQGNVSVWSTTGSFDAGIGDPYC